MRGLTGDLDYEHQGYGAALLALLLGDPLSLVQVALLRRSCGRQAAPARRIIQARLRAYCERQAASYLANQSHFSAGTEAGRQPAAGSRQQLRPAGDARR